jgi:hypothetical protein
MRGQGHQTFVDELARFAAGLGDARVTAIAERAAAPLRVVVRGRRGVGRRTVASALGQAGVASGIAVMPPARGVDPDADVIVYVTAEVLKPEDLDAIADGVAARRPVLGVLNKADLVGSLSGRGPDGPVAAAQARCAQLSALAGVPMEPMIGLLSDTALHDLDQEVWDALGVLAAPVGASDPARERQRLLESLDMFGTALAVAAVRRGGTASQVRTLLRRVSCVDAVVVKICALGAEARYRRVLDAVAELEALSVARVTDEDLEERISGFLSHDATVVARMAAAVAVVEAAGLEVGPVFAGGDPAAHLPRAAQWRRYSRAQVSGLHRACGADIARGSLRLWSQTCGSQLEESLPEESQ